MLVQATVLSFVVHSLIVIMVVMVQKGETDLIPRHFEAIIVDIASMDVAREMVAPEKPHPVRDPIRESVSENLLSKTVLRPALTTPPKEMKTSPIEPSTVQAKTSITRTDGVSVSQSIVFPPLQTEIVKPRANVNSFAGEVSAPRNPQAPAFIDQRYLNKLKALIESRKEYPLMARKGHWEGTVRVGCLVSRDGELMDVMLISSSGHSILDSAALRAVRAAGPFPPVPSEIRGDSFSFIAPITYQLASE